MISFLSALKLEKSGQKDDLGASDSSRNNDLCHSYG